MTRGPPKARALIPMRRNTVAAGAGFSLILLRCDYVSFSLSAHTHAHALAHAHAATATATLSGERPKLFQLLGG